MAGSVCLQPSRSVTEGPQAVKAVEAAVQVDDRGAADGECLEDALVKGKRGTKPLDRRHREEWDPRLDGVAHRRKQGDPRTDGGSTSTEIKTKDIRTGALLTSPRPPPGPGGASGNWHLAASGSGGI